MTILRLSERELRDLLSAVESDKVGKWGDDRSLRLDKLESKLKRVISTVKKESEGEALANIREAGGE
jgi:hypothetical protein